MTFDDGSVRGGLLGQGSMLTVTSYATRTSPVLRGKWVLENILGLPPPPPPANVPALERERRRQSAVDARADGAASRESGLRRVPQSMDPMGLAARELRRRRPLAQHAKRTAGEPIDASGALPDGSKFEGAIGLKQTRWLPARDLFVATMTEKLLTYALGRGLEHYDAPAVRPSPRTTAAATTEFFAHRLGMVRSRRSR